MLTNSINSINFFNGIQNGVGENDPRLAELIADWDAWYENPDYDTGKALLTFLEKNKEYFEKLEEGKQPPPGFPSKTPFNNYYQTAIGFLKSWIKNGCNPEQKAPVSEWIADIVTWLKQPKNAFSSDSMILTRQVVCDTECTSNIPLSSFLPQFS